MVATKTYQSGFKTTLALALSASDTTATLAVVPTVTSGRLYLTDGQQEEWMSFTGVSGSTVTGLTRGLSQTADPATAGTGKTWIAGTKVRLVAMHDQLPDKLQGNAFLGSGNIYATTAARDAAIGGDGVATLPYTDVYVTATGLHYNYNLAAGAWQAISTGTATPNATTTVAGKVELPTDAEVTAGTPAGGTGATLTPTNEQLAKSVSLKPAATSVSDTDEVALNQSSVDKRATLTAISNYVRGLNITAGENLTAGDLAYIDSDGKAYKTVRSATASAQIGTTTGVDSSTSEEMIQCEYLSDDKVIVLYKKAADDKIYGRVCTFSRTTITVGGETNISADVLQAACGFTFTVLTSSLFVVAYRKNSDNIGYAVACTVSGTTITAGSPTQLSATIFVASAACTMQACKVSASKFLVIGQKGTTTTGSPQVICGSVSGTTITAGTTVTIAALSGTGTYRCCYIQDDVVFTAYDDGANVRMTPLTISGTTITTKTELNNAATGTLGAGDRLIYLGNGTILLIRNSTQFSINTYNIADQTSWTVATIGTPLYNVNNDTANSSYAQAYYLGNNMLAIANQTVGPSDVRMRLFKIINNSLVPMGDTTIAATAGEMGVCKLNTLQNKIFTVWRETGTTNANFSVYWDTSSQYIGVVSTTTTANNTAPIASSGIAVGTGLTVGQTYYVGDAGAAATSGVKQIGAGITTTSLLLI